ncbi:cytochrome C nitrite reductase [Sphingomonas sp. PB4P5]|uniref:cytochrome C nitrite reductase n=1 Tax=Parasphingomonas puruogangriensis TaxID=3096155 RepID=UPI002FC698BE
MSGRAITAVALALFTLLAIGWTALTHRLNSAALPSVAAAEPSVSSGGVTLTSDAITLPEETAALPAGSDLITANCTACHSAEMLTTQPALNAEKWQATIDKMRGVYKAPIAPADDKALIAELLALPAQRPQLPEK